MAWHRISYISNNKHTFNVINLIASFVFFLGLIGFIVSFSNLFHQWDTLSNIKGCFESAHTLSEGQICQNYFYQTTGVALYPSSPVPDQAVNVMVSFAPMMSLFFWIIIMLLGIFFFNVGNNWHELVNQYIYRDFSKKKVLTKDNLPSYLDEKPTKRKLKKAKK